MHTGRVLFKNTIVDLIHPQNLDRNAYTLSYPVQRLIESYQGGSKPNILIVGGYHAVYKMNQRGIQAFHAGSSADQTPTMVSKRHGSTVAGTILSLKLDKKGDLESLEWDVFPLYR